jgi:hypothetical protein
LIINIYDDACDEEGCRAKLEMSEVRPRQRWAWRVKRRAAPLW